MKIKLRVVQFWSEIILVISNPTRAARLFDFEITCMLSDQITLHSVPLPLCIGHELKVHYYYNFFHVREGIPWTETDLHYSFVLFLHDILSIFMPGMTSLSLFSPCRGRTFCVRPSLPLFQKMRCVIRLMSMKQFFSCFDCLCFNWWTLPKKRYVFKTPGHYFHLVLWITFDRGVLRH